MSDDEIKAALVDRSVLALTMYGEARGDVADGSSVEERIAVGCVIRNRKATPGAFRAKEPTYRAVCLAPAQFSCWSVEGGGKNYEAVMTYASRIAFGFPLKEPLLDECLFLADGIISGVLLDVTGSATHYWSPRAMVPPGRVPTWAEGKPTRAIGAHFFLRA